MVTLPFSPLVCAVVTTTISKTILSKRLLNCLVLWSIVTKILFKSESKNSHVFIRMVILILIKLYMILYIAHNSHWCTGFI